MAVRTLAKAYAAFSLADENTLAAVEQAGQEALGHETSWAFLEGDTLRISWEGLYFPLEDVLSALAATLGSGSAGKLDYLDLEEWTLTRYVPGTNGFQASKRDLNQVLDYSGH